MHIIVLAWEPTSLRGGQETVLFDVCRGLAQRGYTISLLYTKEGDLLQRYQEFCKHTIKVHRFIISLPGHIFNFLADIRNISGKISTFENSIVLCNQVTDTPFGYALALSQNIPLVCYLHYPPIRPSWIAESKGIKRLKYFLLEPIHKLQWTTALKKVKRFIAVSIQMKLDWVNTGYKEGLEEIIDVVYNGIDLEVYKPANDLSRIRKEWKIPTNISVISYVGRIDKQKGLETLIKAFALLLKTGVHTKLLIAGKPVAQGEEYKKYLEQLATDLGIENHVDFLGHITNTTSLYQVSDVTVVPSLWSEPFGRVIVESMACGTPVVASRIGGIPESLTGEFQNGLFEPGNERDLSDTLNRIVYWRAKEPKLGERCREHVVSKFSLDKMVDGVEKVLEHRFIKLFA
ncbi:group 1 glycosyl transferase [Kalymmatonema gypsitolerans NIES-4073]|nr:group 1 glycosyl transferase [Scytonema sp. NIES-4073]